VEDHNSDSTHSSQNPDKRESKSKLAKLQNFEAWKKACDELLDKPFPPQSSNFSTEDIEGALHINFSKFSNWQIICEEILDTEHPHTYLQKGYEELRRRGKSEQEIFEMRRFAWYTAGWFNFPMMVWDWVNLDETDILLAIKWLFDYEQITQEQRIEFEDFVRLHSDKNP
jgi:hypothetical protein